jgi:hypothetical protein
MTLTLELAPEVEAALREEAERSGRNPEDLATEALRARLRLPAQGPKLSPEEWARKAAAFAESNRHWPVLPDSAYERENFYGERG